MSPLSMRFQRSRSELERQGRWAVVRGALFTGVGCYALHALPAMVATGTWSSVAAIPSVVPARLSLVFWALAVGAAVVVAFEAAGLERRSPSFRPLRWIATTGVIVATSGAAVELVIVVHRWFEVDDGRREATHTIAVDAFGTVAWCGMVLTLIAAVLSSPRLWWPMVEGVPVEPRILAGSSPVARLRTLIEPGTDTSDESPPDGTIICCSGGGIRSTAFSLGGLQELTDQGVYHRSDHVVGVSGGGYIAAAYHVTRWNPNKNDAEDDSSRWQQLDPAAFAPQTPEMRWLRGRTQYLLESAQVATMGFLALLWGIAVNLLLLTISIGAAAWWLAWFYAASGGLRGWESANATAADYRGSWSWASYWWLPVLVAAAGYVGTNAADRYRTLPHRVRKRATSATVFTLWAGIAVIIALLAIPKLLVGIHDYTVHSGSAFATLFHVAGIVPTSACRAATGPSVCGAHTANNPQVFAVSFAAVLGAVLTVVKTASSAVDPATGSGRLLRTVWKAVKVKVLPWVATLVIVAVIVLVAFRGISRMQSHPTAMANWPAVYAAVIALVLLKLLTDANRTSLHHFYRERLAYAFFVHRRQGAAVPVAYRRALRFSESAPPRGHGPGLVACAVANVSDVESVPSRRGCTPFVFDHERIGLTDVNLQSGPQLVPSAMYEQFADSRARDATLTAAIAMSGAAVSPLAGRANLRLGPYRFVLAVANARLGVWLPNPLWFDVAPHEAMLHRLRWYRSVRPATWSKLTPKDQKAVLDTVSTRQKAWLCGQLTGDQSTRTHAVFCKDRASCERFSSRAAGVRLRRAASISHDLVRDTLGKPGASRVAREAVGRTSIHDRSLYITDGGHYDNLGLVEALRRRPATVFLLDASADPENTFRALGEAIATARMDLGVEIGFEPDRMRRVGEKRAAAAWGTATVEYPDGETAIIHIAKVIMVDGLPWDTESYAAQHSDFPRTSTSEQLYGEFDLEAYRILGREVTRRMLAPLSRQVSTVGEGRHEDAADREEYASVLMTVSEGAASGTSGECVLECRHGQAVDSDQPR